MLFASLRQCLASCPSAGYFLDEENICQDCHPTCLSCSGALQTECTACPPAFHFAPSLGTCVSSCAPGFYLTQGRCELCDASCAQCIDGTPTGCTACGAELILNPGTRSCVAVCPAGLYASAQLGTCEACHSDCATCSGPGSNRCLTCTGSLFFTPLAQECVAVCRPGFFYTNQECHECHSSCLTCIDQLETSCSTCPPASFLLISESRCLPECPSDTYKAGSLCIRKSRSLANSQRATPPAPPARAPPVTTV